MSARLLEDAVDGVALEDGCVEELARAQHGHVAPLQHPYSRHARCSESQGLHPAEQAGWPTGTLSDSEQQWLLHERTRDFPLQDGRVYNFVGV